MKKTILFIAILLLAYCVYSWPSKNLACFSNNCFEIEIAETSAQRQRGLMFRDQMEKDKGMLFVFEKADLYSFWMKDTRIPLDIIWLSDNFEVVHMEQAAPCDTEDCPSYTPNALAKYVLEVNAGEAKDIQIGDKAKIDRYE